MGTPVLRLACANEPGPASCPIIDLSVLSIDALEPWLAEVSVSVPPDPTHDGLCESGYQQESIEHCRLTSITIDSENLVEFLRASSTACLSSVEYSSVSEPSSSTSGV